MKEGENIYEPNFLKLFIHKEEGISSSTSYALKK
jgi:hypothetical protein